MHGSAVGTKVSGHYRQGGRLSGVAFMPFNNKTLPMAIPINVLLQQVKLIDLARESISYLLT